MFFVRAFKLFFTLIWVTFLRPIFLAAYILGAMAASVAYFVGMLYLGYLAVDRLDLPKEWVFYIGPFWAYASYISLFSFLGWLEGLGGRSTPTYQTLDGPELER